VTKRSQVAATLVLALAAARPGAAAEDVRVHFETTMAAIARELPALVVTSTHRTEADQARLAEAGYRPHPRSQHKLGLAWDCAGPEEALAALRERAAAAGFVALAMTSPVTGDAYVHVQRWARSPALELAPRMLALRAPLATDAEEPFATVSNAAPAIEPPRPLDPRAFDFPPRLLRKPVEGRIVLLLELSQEGRVLDVEIDESSLPAFDAVVAKQVQRWRFTPTRIDGRPMATYARLPIPIRVQ
jgi:TonB family protein